MGTMTEHKIEYRGFPVPETFLGTPSLFVGTTALNAWKAGVDTVLDATKPDPVWQYVGYTPGPVTVTLDSYKPSTAYFGKGSLHVAPLPKYQPVPEIEDGYEYYSREQGYGRKTTYYRIKTTDQKDGIWSDVVDARYHNDPAGPARIKTEWLTWPYLQGSDATSIKRSQVPADFRMPGYNVTRYDLKAGPYSAEGWFILDGTDQAVYRWKDDGYEDSAFSVSELQGYMFKEAGRGYIDPAEFKTR